MPQDKQSAHLVLNALTRHLHAELTDEEVVLASVSPPNWLFSSSLLKMIIMSCSLLALKVKAFLLNMQTDLIVAEKLRPARQ